MCLEFEKDFDVGFIGYKIMCINAFTGRLQRFRYGADCAFPENEWMNEEDYRYSWWGRQDTLSNEGSNHPHFFYPLGWHLCASLSEIREFATHFYTIKDCVICKVAFKDVRKTGTQYGARVIVAGKIKILKRLESVCL
jgi:hypothetical protein